MVQTLCHSNQMILNVGQVKALNNTIKIRIENVRERLTISDFGAMLQFSLHLFASPLTTSALFPMSRRRLITFFRHVPILEI